MKTLSRLLFLVMLLASSGVARASVRRQPIQSQMLTLGYFIRIYQKKEGRYPASWSELEERYPRLTTDFALLDPTRRVALLTPPLEMTGRHAGWTAVAMTRDAVRQVAWKQTPVSGSSYAVLKDPVHILAIVKDGAASILTMSPEAARALFQKNGLTFPQPSGLGPYPHEKRYAPLRSDPLPFLRDAILLAGPVAVIAWLVSVCIRSRPRRWGGGRNGRRD